MGLRKFIFLSLRIMRLGETHHVSSAFYSLRMKGNVLGQIQEQRSRAAATLHAGVAQLTKERDDALAGFSEQERLTNHLSR